MLLRQFLELSIVLVTSIEQVIPLLLCSQQLLLLLLLLLLLFCDRLEQILFDRVVHKDIQLFLEGNCLQLWDVDLHDAF